MGKSLKSFFLKIYKTKVYLLILLIVDQVILPVFNYFAHNPQILRLVIRPAYFV